MAREIRCMVGGCELRSEGEGEARKIAGHAARFDSQTELWPGFFELVRPGAFAKTLQEANVRGVFNHDPSALLGSSRSGTLRLAEDGQGLAYEIDPPDTQVGRDVVELLRRGDLYGSSFAFEVIKDQRSILPDGKSELREILEVRLYDVGPVTFPAYEQAEAQLRSAVAASLTSRGAGLPMDLVEQAAEESRRAVLAALSANNRRLQLAAAE